MKPATNEIRTNVGCAGFGENYFKGRGLIAELAGVETTHSLVSMAIDGPELDAAANEIFDYLSAVTMAADPRIWPFKICRLIASYGSPLVAQGVTELIFEGSFLGPNAVAGAARVLMDAAGELGEERDDGQAARDYLAGVLDEQEVVLGFGVVARDFDERQRALDGWYTANFAADGVYWRTSQRLIKAADELRGLKPNVALPWSAVLLDLGYDPNQIKLLAARDAHIILTVMAHEGVNQVSESLQRLDDRWVVYRGPEGRVSPRALQAR